MIGAPCLQLEANVANSSKLALAAATASRPWSCCWQNAVCFRLLHMACWLWKAVLSMVDVQLCTCKQCCTNCCLHASHSLQLMALCCCCFACVHAHCSHNMLLGMPYLCTRACRTWARAVWLASRCMHLSVCIRAAGHFVTYVLDQHSDRHVVDAPASLACSPHSPTCALTWLVRFDAALKTSGSAQQLKPEGCAMEYGSGHAEVTWWMHKAESRARCFDSCALLAKAQKHPASER